MTRYFVSLGNVCAQHLQHYYATLFLLTAGRKSPSQRAREEATAAAAAAVAAERTLAEEKHKIKTAFFGDGDDGDMFAIADATISNMLSLDARVDEMQRLDDLETAKMKKQLADEVGSGEYLCRIARFVQC
jgi:hypothetical protein